MGSSLPKATVLPNSLAGKGAQDSVKEGFSPEHSFAAAFWSNWEKIHLSCLYHLDDGKKQAIHMPLGKIIPILILAKLTKAEFSKKFFSAH